MTASIISFGSERCRIQPLTPFGLLIEPTHNAQPVQGLVIEGLRELARRHGVLILRGFESGFTDPELLTRYSEAWGEIMMWPFGAVLDVKEHENATDHIFDSSYVPLHWDGMYKPTVPEFQLFHCVHAPAEDEGGRTTFINTRQLLADLDDERLARWERVQITYRIKQVVHYGGQVSSPLLVPHPVSGETVIRYNEPPREGVRFLNQHALQIEGVPTDEQDAFLHDLHEQLYDPRYFYAHQWQPGDVVIADNFGLLHGREGFTSRSARHIQRVHIQASPLCLNPSLAPQEVA